MIVTHMCSSGISQIDYALSEDIWQKYPPWIRKKKPHPQKIYGCILLCDVVYPFYAQHGGCAVHFSLVYMSSSGETMISAVF